MAPSLLLVSSAVASPRESLEMTNGWKAAYCERIDEQPSADAWGDYPRRDPWWQSVDFATAASKPSKKPEDYNGMWLKQDQVVPAAWAGRRIRVELPVPIRRCDGVVFVNGQKAGDILRPGGALDITAFARCGETNAIALFLTQDGSGTQRGVTKVNRWDNGIPRGLMAFPRLLATDGAFVSDVFADPSVQKHELTLEVEVDADREAEARLEARILDPDGGTVKTLTRPVTLKPGINRFKPQIPWRDPHFWDFGDGYLYTCEVNLTTGDSKDVYPAFRFGFRELWREGRNLVMNGRPLHMRVSYSYQASSTRGMQFLQDVGYTVLAYSHEYNGFPYIPEILPVMENADQVGMGVIVSCGAVLGIVDDTLPDNPQMQETYREFVGHFHRKYRNHPSLVASYVSQMIICNIADFTPDRIGQTVGTSNRDRVIDKAREINREFNPNILYYSHADGPNGDMSSGNLYFNWTPQQEMDEWLSEWADKGIYPWHGAEFETPYGGCWWYGGGFGMTEYLASFFGDRAYDEEPARELDSLREFSSEIRSAHGASYSRAFDRYTDVPLYWTWRKNAVQGINRHWRGYGLNGGLLWFNLDQAYGSPVNDFGQRTSPLFQRYRDLPDDFVKGSRPAWANPAYDIYKPVNQDFCGYLAGSPEQADKTHAFYAGETIEKQAAFIWDGHAKQDFSADWKAILSGDNREIAGGHLARTMEPGAIVFEKFSFPAPEVDCKQSGRIELTYGDGTKDVFSFEVYPRKTKVKPVVPEGVRLAVFDPAGDDEGMLTALGIPHRTVASPDEIGDATHLLIGRRTLSKFNLGVKPERLAAGLKVLIMPQAPTTWESLGFKVQDTMSRTVFLRDKANPSFAAISPDMLSYWRGAPDYGEAYKRVMEHSSQRGPCGTRRHTVAGLVLQVPEKAGFVPLIDGGYDLNFAALMRFEYGKGAVTACTLDLEGRVEADPAATEVARAVLSDFLSYRRDESKAIACDGDAATKLAAELGFATSGTGDVILVGGDGKTDWSALRAKAEAGATVCVYANAALAKAAGFELEPRQFYRAPVGGGSLFRCFTSSLLRWRDVLKADALTAAGGDSADAVISADGLFAQMPVGKGCVVFCQIEPFELSRRYADEPDEKAVAADRQWLMGVVRGVMEQLGAPKPDAADPSAGRSLNCSYWDQEGKTLLADSGVGRGGRKGTLLVAGVAKYKNTWRYLRHMAESGNTVLIVDNAKVAEEAGFQVGARQLISSLDVSTLGLPPEDSGVHRFVLDRSVRRLEKAPEGFAISADGLLADGAVGSGRVVFLQLNPAEWDQLSNNIGRIRDSNDISRERSLQMFARMLTNLGAEPSAQMAARALYQAHVNAFAPLPAAHVLGPFITTNDSGERMLGTVFSDEGEKMTIAGDFNPNIDFPLPQGGTANWRPMLTPESTGLYDFQKLYPEASFPVTYSIVHFNRREAGPATLKIGVDWRTVVWCNGREVFRTLNGAHFPKYEIPLDLRKGDNVLSFKVGAGRAGNKLWALISGEPDPDAAVRESNAELDAVHLYAPVRERTDPYLFNYW